VSIVATPFVVRQVQGDWCAVIYRRRPNSYPTTDFLGPCLFLGRFPDTFAVRCAQNRAARSVNRLPMHFLAFLGLQVGLVSVLENNRVCGGTDAVEGDPEATRPGCEIER
jgi:hypothetical protein